MKVCAEPGCPALIRKGTTEGRCQAHRKYSPTYHQRDSAETKRRAAAVDAWVKANGWVCPGWPPTRHPEHPCHDLTAHHVQSVVNHGTRGALAVLCRSENSRLQDRNDVGDTP